jgi:hypothetical protein
MPATTNGDQQFVLARELDGADDVVCSGAAGDERRIAIDGAVPDTPCLVVPFFSRAQEGTPELPPKSL